MEEPSPPTQQQQATREPAVDLTMSFAVARRGVITEFERRYLTALLEAHNGVVARAARASGIDRVFLHKLLKRHGLR